MKKNLEIAGVTYKDVPSITVPDGTGGSATFVCTSDATATAADVATGKSFYDSGGKLVTGTGTVTNYDDYDTLDF